MAMLSIPNLLKGYVFLACNHSAAAWRTLDNGTLVSITSGVDTDSAPMIVGERHVVAAYMPGTKEYRIEGKYLVDGDTSRAIEPLVEKDCASLREALVEIAILGSVK